MDVRDLMTKRLLSIGESDSLAMAAHRMAWAGCRHLPVLRKYDVVGVLSEGDILRWCGAGHGLDGPDDRVSAAMSAPPIVAVPDEKLGEAAARMISSRIGCLPVVIRGQLVGMITTTDFLGRHVAQTFDTAPGRDGPAASVMTPSVLTVSLKHHMREAADLMASARIRHLPVVDEDGRLVGMLSERDLRGAFGSPDRTLEGWPPGPVGRHEVREFMSVPVVSVRAEQPLDQVLTSMVNRRLSALPVVDHENRPVGIISYLDVLRAVR